LPFAGTKQEKDISDYFKAGYTRENFIRLFIDFLETYSASRAAAEREKVTLNAENGLPCPE
jgi:hypothetical protein